jgi:transcriptional regulator with XRE-family HTH domain
MAGLSPERLRALRQAKVLTQGELGELAGVRTGTIADLENGRHVARPSTIRKLAKALEVSPQDLLEH